MVKTHLLAVATVAAAAALAPSPALARRPADVTFGGMTSSQWPVMVQLSRDRRQMVYAVAAWSAQCTGGPFSDYAEFDAVRVSARGRFSTSFDSGDIQQGTATSRYAASITGKLNKSRSKITGNVRVSFTAKDPANALDETCDTGTVRYVAVD
jgi:hypothetical protein